MAQRNNQFTENVFINANPNETVLFPPPKYDDVYAIPTADIPPPQYGQSLSYLPRQPQTELHPDGIEMLELRYERLHKIFGIIAIVFGVLVMILDPLLPALFQYYYSLFAAGIFMVISGICSIHGSRKRNICSLVASLVFNILSIILLFIAYIMGILAAGNPRISKQCLYYYDCIPSFYLNGIRGLGVFNTIMGLFLFILVLWDSTLKCGTVCCKRRPNNSVNYNATNQTLFLQNNP